LTGSPVIWRYLALHFDVVDIEHALAASRRTSARPHACATFGDGCASVHDLTLPVFGRLRIPATAYLATDLVDSDQTVWFMRLRQAISDTSAPESAARYVAASAERLGGSLRPRPTCKGR
jgi:hypothetical protein